MEDLIKSFKAQLYDRVSSPLFGALLISWTAWNHRLFFVLLSSLDVAKRFSYIDEALYPTWHEVLGRGALFPLLSALFLIYIYPIPARRVYGYVRSEQKKLKEIQQRIDDETPITQEEARELRSAIRKADADFEKEIAQREELIAKLKLEVARLDSEAKSKATETAIRQAADAGRAETLSEIDLDAEQVELLRKIATSPDGIEVSLARRVAASDAVVAQFNIDELLRHKLIIQLRSVQKGSVYKTTAYGRSFLVRNGSKLVTEKGALEGSQQ